MGVLFLLKSIRIPGSGGTKQQYGKTVLKKRRGALKNTYLSPCGKNELA